MADHETYERTNTDITYERLRDDLLHEAKRLQAEIVVLAEMLEEERQLRPRRRAWSWVTGFQDRLSRELGNTLHRNTYLEEYLRIRGW